MKNTNAFDFLRLFASLTVIVGHSVTHFQTSFLWHGKSDNLWFYDGVAMFFVLSGFLVYKSCAKAFENNRPIYQYYINRILRIVPAVYFYLIIVTISFFAFGVLKFDEISTTFIAWIGSTLLMFPVFHPADFADFGIGVVNGSLWTIPVEFGFYIVLPLIVLLQRKFNSKTMVSIMVLLSVFGLSLFNYFDNIFNNIEPLWFKLYTLTFFPYLLYFTTGIILSMVWGKIKKNNFLAIGSLLLYILIRYELLFSSESVYLFWELLWVIPFGYFVIWFGYNGPSFLNKFTNKIGDISYGTYIWHMVVINYFIYFNIDEKLTGTVLILLVLIVTVLLALISWWLVEKKILKYKPYNSNKKIEEVDKVNKSETITT